MEPRYIFIEPTNTCNITCIMCPVTDNKKMTRVRRMLTIEQLDSLLDANPKARVVYLTNWGEPMLNKLIAQIIAACVKRDLFVVMTTNATLITPGTAQAILDSGLGAVRFSLDGVGEAFEKVRSVRGGYARVKENIELFLRLRDEGGYRTAVELNVTYMRENLDGVRMVESEWKDKVDFINYQGVISAPMIQIGERTGSPRRAGRCRQLYRSAFFLTDGNTVPCCADFNGELVLGNQAALRNAFQLMNSPVSRSLRRQHNEGKLPSICAACTQYSADIFPRRQSAIV
jgi:MoaA/NifB/PqqE/SkfB family radical SAM enzyme